MGEYREKDKTFEMIPIAIILSAIGGVLMGLREALHADPHVFERIWKVGPVSFWGGEQWKTKYVDNDPSKKMKTQLFGNFGRDMWHTFDKLQRICLVVSTVVATICVQRFGAETHWKVALLAALALAPYSIGYYFAYKVRYKGQRID